MQERLVRGYIYQLLKERYNLSAAVIITTAIFMLMHSGAVEAGAIPVINIITMCLLLRRYMSRSKRSSHLSWRIQYVISSGL